MGLLDRKLFTSNVSSASAAFITFANCIFFLFFPFSINSSWRVLPDLPVIKKFSEREAERPDDAHHFYHNPFQVQKPDFLHVQYLRTTGQLWLRGWRSESIMLVGVREIAFIPNLETALLALNLWYRCYCGKFRPAKINILGIDWIKCVKH